MILAYYIFGGAVVAMTEACSRISSKQSLSKQILYLGMPLWVPDSNFILVYLNRACQSLKLSPHTATFVQKVPEIASIHSISSHMKT